MSFKVGDIVECIRPKNSLTLGKKYKILSMDGSTYLHTLNDRGSQVSLYTDRFKIQSINPNFTHYITKEKQITEREVLNKNIKSALSGDFHDIESLRKVGKLLGIL